MLILHPNSRCDVCLEGYDSTNAPYSISCGHIFCLSCLQSLTRHCCPLCRTGFGPSDVRRLHIDKGGRPPTPPPASDSTERAESSSLSRQFHDRITRVVLIGDTSLSAVQSVLEDVRLWLVTQPVDEHADLRAVHKVLYRYCALQRQAADDKETLSELQSTCDDLRERARLERDAADLKRLELSRLSDEMEMAKATEQSLRQQYEELDKEWSGKFEHCETERRRLADEVKDLRRKGHSPTSRSGETRLYYLMDRNSSNPEPMAIVKEDPSDSTSVFKVQIGGKDDVFHLSPVPMTVPIPALPQSTTLRAFTDDADDRDEDQKSANNPYLLRSIQDFPIRSSLQRMSSSSSLFGRHDSDAVPRSLPRTSVDVHMASCSSSPTASTFQYALRDRSGETPSAGIPQESALGLRLNGSRRTSQGSSTDSRDQDEPNERQRAQLRELLGDSKPPTTLFRRNTVSNAGSSQHSTPELSGVPRHPSPVSAGASASASVLSQSICRASEAAMAVERTRASSTSTVSSPAPSHVSPTREREASQPQLQYQAQIHSQRPQYQRHPSTDNVRGKTTPAVSGLTRSLWASQEAPRVS